MALYRVPMRVVLYVEADVEADDVDDAKRKAEAMDFLDSGIGGASWEDWEIKGEPEKIDD